MKKMRDVKNLIGFSFLVVSLMACQVSPNLSTTSDLQDQAGRFYFHSVGQSGSGALPETKIYIDKSEYSNLEELDSRGVEQTLGRHEVGFKGRVAPSGLSEIDYNIEKGRHLHLYYCESDGSVHWLSIPKDSENPLNMKKKGQRLCDEGQLKKKE